MGVPQKKMWKRRLRGGLVVLQRARQRFKAQACIDVGMTFLIIWLAPSSDTGLSGVWKRAEQPRWPQWKHLEGYKDPPNPRFVREVEDVHEVYSDPVLRRAGYVLALEKIPLNVWTYLQDHDVGWSKMYDRAFGYEYAADSLAAAALRRLLASIPRERWRHLDYLLTTPARRRLWRMATCADGMELVPVRPFDPTKPSMRARVSRGLSNMSRALRTWWPSKTAKYVPNPGFEVVRRKGAGRDWNEYQLPSLF